MADKVKVTLLRPLNGAKEGTEAEYDRADAERLAAFGSVEIKNLGAAPSNKARTAAPANKASDSMTKAELLAMAKREGVNVETDDNKADLIRKINGA